MRGSGKKSDAGKRRYDLVPPDALRSIVDVLTAGAVEYGDQNWRSVAGGHARYYAAMMRHVEAWRGGEWLDEKSKLPHLAHAATNVIFLLCLGRQNKHLSDKTG